MKTSRIALFAFATIVGLSSLVGLHNIPRLQHWT